MIDLADEVLEGLICADSYDLYEQLEWASAVNYSVARATIELSGDWDGFSSSKPSSIAWFRNRKVEKIYSLAGDSVIEAKVYREFLKTVGKWTEKPPQHERYTYFANTVYSVLRTLRRIEQDASHILKLRDYELPFDILRSRPPNYYTSEYTEHVFDSLANRCRNQMIEIEISD